MDSSANDDVAAMAAIGAKNARTVLWKRIAARLDEVTRSPRPFPFNLWLGVQKVKGGKAMSRTGEAREISSRQPKSLQANVDKGGDNGKGSIEFPYLPSGEDRSRS
jgi:hypothetical protein